MITIKTRNLLHAGGTKFYEQVLVTCPATDTAVLIKRWGKVAVKLGGGQMQCFDGSVTQMASEYANVWRSKAKTSEYSLHNEGANRLTPFLTTSQMHSNFVVDAGQTAPEEYSVSVRPGDNSGDEVIQAVTAALAHHYGDTDQAKTIMSMLNIEGRVTKREDFDEGEIVIEEPEAPVDRGDQWASW